MADEKLIVDRLMLQKTILMYYISRPQDKRHPISGSKKNEDNQKIILTYTIVSAYDSILNCG
jgi:hypothetical protein